jgi:hypothetical protein
MASHAVGLREAGSGPETWVTDRTGDIGDNLVPIGLSKISKVFCSRFDAGRRRHPVRQVGRCRIHGKAIMSRHALSPSTPRAKGAPLRP